MTLKNGKVLEGKIVSYNDTALKIETPEGLYKAKFRLLDTIESTAENPAGLETNPTVLEGVLVKLEEVNASKIKHIEDLQARIKNKKIEMYSAPWCPYCKLMDKMFRENGITYVSYNIDYDLVARKRYESLRGRGIPLVVIDDTVIRGFNPGKVWAALLK